MAEVAGDERAIPRVGQTVVHPQIFEPPMVTHPTRMGRIQASGFRFIREAGAEGLSHWMRCPNGAQDSAPGDQPWVFAWETDERPEGPQESWCSEPVEPTGCSRAPSEREIDPSGVGTS